MELNDLKSNWQSASFNKKNENDLQKMTKLTSHPIIQKMRNRFIIQTTLLIVVLAVFYDGFDGSSKPLYANAALIFGVILYILNEILGYISLSRLIMAENISDSVMKYLLRLRKLSSFSVVATIGYCMSIFVFFTSTIIFTKEKGFLLLFAMIITTQLVLFSNRIWKKRISVIERVAKDLK